MSILLMPKKTQSRRFVPQPDPAVVKALRPVVANHHRLQCQQEEVLNSQRSSAITDLSPTGSIRNSTLSTAARKNSNYGIQKLVNSRKQHL
jgi:hypothetical protein